MTNEEKVQKQLKNCLTVKQVKEQLSKFNDDSVVLFRLDGAPDPYRYPLWPVHDVSELDYGADVPVVEEDGTFLLRSYSVAAHDDMPEVDDPWAAERCVMIHTHVSEGGVR